MLKGRRYRTILSIILTAAMIFSGMQTVAFANPESDGDAVQINTAEDLIDFAKKVNNGDDYDGKTVRLTDDIDLPEEGDWTPIGTQSNPFSGTFDGGGYTVSGMHITVSESVTSAGFFGCVHNGTIKNVNLKDAEIDGNITTDKTYRIGGLVAANKEGNTSNNTLTVMNCSVDVDISIEVKSQAELSVGGIVGWTETNWSTSSALISDTKSDVDINYNAYVSNYKGYVGGFLGSAGNVNGSFSVTDCNGNLKVNVNSDSKPKNLSIGGIFGKSDSSSEPKDKKIDYLIITGTTVNSELNFNDAGSALSGKLSFCKTSIGGFIGSGGTYSKIESSSAVTELLSNIENYYFGNIVGNSNSPMKPANWDTVYTYAVQADDVLCTTSTGKRNYWYATYKDVYYFSPNRDLKIGTEAEPFEIKGIKDDQETTPNINDDFKYVDGDNTDGFEVRSDADGKKITVSGEISGEAGRCSVKVKNTSKGIELLMPLTVYPEESLPRFSVKTVVEGSDFCKLKCDKTVSVEPGTTVTITATPVPNDPEQFSCFMLDSVTVTDSNGKVIFEEQTDKGELGEKVYSFEMPDSDVTVSGKFRRAENYLTMLPERIEFGPLTEGYTTLPEAETVTIKNEGDTDTTVDLERFDTHKKYYTLTPLEGNWSDSKITLKAGETATFSAQPKLGLATSEPGVNNRISVYIYSNPISYVGVKLLYLTLECNVVEQGDIGGGSSGGSGSGSSHVTTDRIGGANRFETAVKVAERLKDKLGVGRFNTIIVASGGDFADALSAAPLASEKDAPILVVNGYNEDYVKAYIDENLSPDGRVYIIGETAAVPAEFEKSLSSHKVTRLGGADRYETNLEVLKALNLSGESEIMIASGLDYADALSASATGNPVLLVKDCVFDYQKSYLMTLGGDDEYFVIGGTAAVNKRTMNQIEELAGDRVSRVWGDDRFKTAEAVANKFFKNARTMYIASGCDFPDSLTGGVIAHENGAPMLLVSERNYSEAARFADTHSVRKVTAIGGTAAVSDKILYAVAR